MPGRLGQDFFPQKGPAAALDQVELGIDLVSAVDGDVDQRVRFEIGQRNAEIPCGFFGAQRAGNADDVPQFSAADPLAQALQRELGRAAGAEPHHHARFDETGSDYRRLLLEFILGRHAAYPLFKPAV